MPTVYTDVATKENAPHVGEAFLTPQRHHGKVRCVQAAITLAAAGIGDIINVCKLKKGDEVLFDTLIVNAALGASTTLQLGDNDPAGADDDRYIPAASTATAGVLRAAQGAIANMPFAVTGDCWLQAKVGGAAATGLVKFQVFIVRAGA